MKKLFILGSVLAITACTGKVQNYTAISTHSINYDKSINSGEIIKNVRGEDREHIIFFIPTGIPEMQEAVNNALIANNADILLNVKTYTKFWWIPYIYGQQKFVVEGDAVIFGK